MATKELSREDFVKSGRRGGKARLTTMTAEERKKVARKAANTRWAKQKKEK